MSTSTYGLGNGFNEELMVAMARAGGGRQYFGRTALRVRQGQFVVNAVAEAAAPAFLRRDAAQGQIKL